MREAVAIDGRSPPAFLHPCCPKRRATHPQDNALSIWRHRQEPPSALFDPVYECIPVHPTVECLLAGIGERVSGLHFQRAVAKEAF
jgi:hypothetical protein